MGTSSPRTVTQGRSWASDERIPPATYAWTLWPSVGLLPPTVRDEYGLPWGVRERVVAAWLVRGWRAWRPLLPQGFRQMPRALAADRRVR